AKRPDKIRGRRILLIDDVLTTGATVNECARILKRAGAKGVYVLTAARTVPGGEGSAIGDAAAGVSTS
ncbi:MAG TPA: phosphoribosyltransferase family protein, partial [Nitrospiria bacterium]